MVQRRCRGVPGAVKVVGPRQNVTGVEARRAHDAGACAERAHCCAEQPVAVVERHDVETAVLARQLQRLHDVVRSCGEVPVREGYLLRLRGRAGGVQQEGNVVLTGLVGHRSGRRLSQLACLVHLDHSGATFCRQQHWGLSRRRGGHNRNWLDVVGEGAQLSERIGAVHRSAHRGRHGSKYGDQQRGPVGQTDQHSVAAAYAG